MAKKETTLLPLSRLDRFTESAALVLLLFLWGFTIFAWFRLPPLVPLHFDVAGNANHYGSKASIFIEPVIATLIFAGLTWLNKYPGIYNYSNKVAADKKTAYYTSSTRVVRYLKLAVIIIFTSIAILTFFVARGTIAGLGYWFLPLAVLLMFIPTL